MINELKKIGEIFRLSGDVYSYDTITIGNINATYKVTLRKEDGSLKPYLFQKVNTNVFKHPANIMENIDKVTTYIRDNYPNQTTLHFHHTKDKKNYYQTNDGDFWRVINYVESETINTCNDLETIEATGEAFGNFQTQLSGLDGSVLYETIPDFHNTKKRFDTLFENIERDVCGRVGEVAEEIEYLSSVRERAGKLSVSFSEGKIPKRVTHNDTKCNNVLFDKLTHRPLVVIDLDTIMPGMSMYDFGDAVRFIANDAEEDEQDVSRISFNTEKFAAFARGFLSKTRDALAPIEIESLVEATFAITIELAVRFLDDYISGDTYFKCRYPKHNLVRARAQLSLAKDIDRKCDELERIIKSIVEEKN